MSDIKNLANLKPNRGANKAPKRLGRGIGSGLGKTSGKGHKGQYARKSANVRPGFEGGQTPLYRRLPKVGFFSRNRTEYQVINLDTLNKFEKGAAITPEFLFEKGLLSKKSTKVKILGRGKLEKALTIKAHNWSETAEAAIKAAGGQIEEMK